MKRRVRSSSVFNISGGKKKATAAGDAGAAGVEEAAAGVAGVAGIIVIFFGGYGFSIRMASS
jgi:hypothetical protein